MSYIKALAYKNLKGDSASHVLGPLTYIHGPNDSNKSSIIDALMILFLGYHPDPDVPKTNAGVMQFASAAELSITGILDSSHSIHRRFLTNGSSVTNLIEPADFKVDPRLVPLLDHRMYFGKSDNDRVQAVIKMAENLGDEKLIPELLKQLNELRPAEPKEYTAEHAQAITALVKDSPAPADGIPVQQWLNSLLEYAKIKYKEANASVKNFEATTKMLGTANAIDAFAGVTDIETLRKEESRLLAILQEANQQLEQAKVIEKANQQAREKSAAFKAEIEEIRKAFPDLSEDLIARKKSELSKLRIERKAAGEENQKTIERRTQSGMKIGSLQGEIAALKLKIEENQQTIAAIADAECCPSCKTKRQGWQAAAIKQAQAAIDEASMVLKRKEDYERQEKSVLSAATKLVEEEERSFYKMVEKEDQLEADIHEMGEQLTNLKSAQAQADGFVIQAVPDVTEARVTINSVNEKLTEVRAEITKTDAHVSERARIAQVRKLAAEARAKLEMTEALGNFVKEQQAAIVVGAFTPVLELANTICRDILPTPLVYEQGQIGRFIQHRTLGVQRFVPCGTFSTSQKRLVFMAICAGLARQADIRIAIIDELGVFDLANRAKLVANLARAVEAKQLDQVIMIDVNNPPLPYPAGMEVIAQ